MVCSSSDSNSNKAIVFVLRSINIDTFVSTYFYCHFSEKKFEIVSKTSKGIKLNHLENNFLKLSYALLGFHYA